MSKNFELLHPVSADVEKRLAVHDKKLSLYFHGLQRAKAELLGYAFLIGHELNLAKDLLPHGEFEKYVEEKYGLAHTTQLRWRAHASCVLDEWKRLSESGQKDHAVALLKTPLDLVCKKKFSPKQQQAIIEVVPEIMGRKGMVQFIEDCKLMREPKPDGGYRPNKEEVQTWLKEFHPDLAGTEYDKLPPKIQKEFRDYVPPIDPADEMAILESAYSSLEKEIGERVIDEKTFVAFPRERISRLRDLLFDALKTVDDVLNKSKKQ